MLSAEVIGRVIDLSPVGRAMLLIIVVAAHDHLHFGDKSGFDLEIDWAFVDKYRVRP